MSGKRFDRGVLRRSFSEALSPHGFTCAASKRSVFYREWPNQVVDRETAERAWAIHQCGVDDGENKT
jgi:hypothetical protein